MTVAMGHCNNNVLLSKLHRVLFTYEDPNGSDDALKQWELSIDDLKAQGRA